MTKIPNYPFNVNPKFPMVINPPISCHSLVQTSVCYLTPAGLPPPDPLTVTLFSLCVPGRVETGLSDRERARRQGQINIASSDSEVEIVGVQENTR